MAVPLVCKTGFPSNSPSYTAFMLESAFVRQIKQNDAAISADKAMGLI
jgi:hypothetical protein